MAQKSRPRTPRKCSYRGFEGVDQKKTHSGDESVAMIDNFRITDDGSLQKRCGFKRVYNNSENAYPVSASYSLEKNGTEECYFTQGTLVKKYVSSTQSVVDIGAISNATSKPFFFEHLDTLFLCDGNKIFTVGTSSLSESSFYIPLYGKDWPASTAGEINETPNLLWPKVAISYTLKQGTTNYLPFGNLKISNIDALFRNGTRVDASKYSINERYNCIALTEFNVGDSFFALLTFTPDSEYEAQRKALFGSTGATAFYELNKNNLFFWGNETNNNVFYSTAINEENAKITKAYTTNVGFYVPINSFFKALSENDRIRAFIRHYDRVLIMTDSSTWITNLEELENDKLKIKNINASIGCAIPNGCVRIENTLFSIGKDAIYAWSSSSDELNECNAYSISDPIKPLLSNNFFKSCKIHLNYGKREIWFYSPYESKIWIYNYNRRAWYSFSGFTPTAFLDGGDDVRFYNNGSIFVFDQSLHTDARDSAKYEIVGTFKSGDLEFNSKHRKKLCTATVRGAFDGGRLELKVALDGRKNIVYYVTPKNVHSVIPFRIRSGSFSSMSFELITRGNGKQIIHGIELDAD